MHTNGRQRIYSINAEALKPVSIWIQQLEKLWDTHLLIIKNVSEQRTKGNKE